MNSFFIHVGTFILNFINALFHWLELQELLQWMQCLCMRYNVWSTGSATRVPFNIESQNATLNLGLGVFMGLAGAYSGPDHLRTG